MLQCPKCKMNIAYLINIQTGYTIYTVTLDKLRDIEYERETFEKNGNINDFECPLCNRRLFTSEEEAAEFLRGEVL